MSYQGKYKLWLITKGFLNDALIGEKILQELQPTEDKPFVQDAYCRLYTRYIVCINNLNEIYDGTLQVQKREIIQRILIPATKRLLELRKELKEIDLSEFMYIDKMLIKKKIIPQYVEILRPFYFPRMRSEEIQNIIDNPVINENVKNIMGEIVSEVEKQRKSKLMSAINAVRFISRLKISLPEHREIVNEEKYKFTHKSDQKMLIPIKRSVFNSEFYNTSKTIDFSKFEYYTPGGGGKRRRPVEQKIEEPEPVIVPIEEEAEVLEGEEEEELTPEELEQIELELKQNEAAIKIQIAWHYYKLRKGIEAKRIKKLVILGMVDEYKWKSNSKEIERKLRDNLRKKKQLFDEKFIQTCEDEKIRIIKMKTPFLMEDISDHIRAWFREFYDGCADFHRYPEEFEGGTILLLRGETMTPEEFMKAKQEVKPKMTLEQKQKEAERKKAEAEIAQQKKEMEKLIEAEKKAQAAKGPKIYDFSGPEFITDTYLKLHETFEEYKSKWANIDELKNINEDPFKEWIIEDKYAEVHQELRVVVDRLMRLEYELLQKALAKDQKRKYKKAKPPKEKVKKAKKGAVEKDITEDRTIESLYEEMISNDLIVKPDKHTLEDFVGDYNYSAYEMRNTYETDPQPSKGEVRDILRSWTLGMGPVELPKVKSICIAGPPRSGKRYLLQALANEFNAIIIDISPENVVKYSDNMKYFYHLINKIARIFEPTIFFINGAHRIFASKVSKEEAHLKPRLLGKKIVKDIIKRIKPADKILLVGITEEPWLGKLGKMKKCFEKTLLVPNTDYGTNFLMWRTKILEKPGIPRDFNFSPLAIVTKGYQSSDICDNIQRTINSQRRRQLPFKPLEHKEFLEGFLSSTPPMFPLPETDFEKYRKWYSKVDKLAKQRVKLMKQIEIRKSLEADKKKK